MRLPELTELASAKENTEVFTGYNHNLRNSVGEWFDQKNMTTDYYPVASSREKRALQYVSQSYEIPVYEDKFSIEKEILGCVFLDDQFVCLRPVYTKKKEMFGAWFANNGNILGMMNNGQDFQFETGIISSINGKFSLEVSGASEVDLSEIKENMDAVYDIKYTIYDIWSTQIHYESKIVSLETVGEKYIFIFDMDYTGEELSVKNILIFPDKRKTRYGDLICNYSRLFELNEDVRQIVRMGSYVCVFPDGIVYETANKDYDIPVFKIEESINCSDLNLITVISDDKSDNDYTPISLGESYRFEDNQIQYYIEDKGLWVSQPTYVIIYKSNTTDTFGEIAEGDTISLNCQSLNDGSPYAYASSKSGIISDKTNLKVLKKGTLKSDNNAFGVTSDTDYIIVSGYVYVLMHNIKSSDNTNDRNDIRVIANNVTMTRKMPDIAFTCESQNRIWCCSKDGHEIYASALGNPYNFYDYSGIATDSYAVNVGTDGEFTGCINYLGHPLFFKENALHYISGSYPSNNGAIDGMSYAVTTTTDFKGVEKGSERSLAIIDNILYYKSSVGIVAYDGAATTVISDALGKEKFKNAVAGVYKNKYYVSMQDKKGVYHLFVYDTTLGIWCKEDETHVLQFLQVNNELLFTSANDNSIYCVNDEDVLNLEYYKKELDFEWECETGVFGYSYPNNKYLSRFQIRMQIADGAKASIYIQYNSDGIWHRKGEMNGKGIRTHLIPIVPVRCDHMKIKIAGKGNVKIYSIAKIFEEGGDV
nr:MAG TPA: stabilization protein [Caudoviricetes sp.]